MRNDTPSPPVPPASPSSVLPADARRAPAWRRLVSAVPGGVWRATLWAAAFAYFGFAILILVLRWGVLPHIDAYRGDLERMLGASLGLKVAIRAIGADWQGLNPRLSLRGLQIFDPAGRPALAFDHVETVVSWTSLPLVSLRLDRLEVNAPVLAVRREADGNLYVAGIRVNTEAEQGDLADWILQQHLIVIRDATIRWLDLRRGAPELELKRVNLRLENFGSHHRFGITAEPPPGLAAQIDARGDFHGRSFDHPREWKGEAYAALPYTDLAGWRPWLDYPLELPQGTGALRVWLGLADAGVEAVTADVALDGLSVRLRPELPVLELSALRGRLSARLPPGGFEARTQRLALATRDGVRVDPTDLALSWTAAQGKVQEHGELAADGLDLESLTRLAAYVPLESALRQRLAEFSPRGRLYDLKVAWAGASAAPQRYSVRTRFENLGIEAHASVPGFQGLSGTLQGDESGGSVSLASRNAALVMPAVFPEPRLDLDQLTAQASWKVAGGAVELQLESLSLNNRDASGSAFGRYTFKFGEPGDIDLTARLSRGETAAVWRYLPHVVGPEVREWLKRSIVGGRSDDTRLRLKGDLKHFPFVDPKLGIFQVSGRFAGATLRYGTGWPEITRINGTLLFEGRRMRITASQGSIYGAALAAVTAEIPDLGSDDAVAVIRGRASGPTADFLRYVAASPAGESIDHFTDDMRATGNGTLQLALTMPLARPQQTKVEGAYVFADNQIVADPELPPLTGASGRVQFTESQLSMRDVRASLLDSPLSLSAETRNGGVAITLEGSISIAGLRQEFDLPLLDHLSGSAAWHGSINVRRRQVQAQIESDLQGVSSSLPDPFNKTAGDALPLHLERATLPEAVATVRGRGGPPGRDMLRISLGHSVNATLARRVDNGRSVIERGTIGINETPQPGPDRGVLLSATMNSLNLDTWRRLLQGEGGGPVLPLTMVNLKAGAVTAFGQQLSDFSLRASLVNAVWQAQVASDELTGELNWRSQGPGRLRARLKQLSVVEVKPQPVAESAPEDGDVKELPGLDVEADSFSLRGKNLGRLELQAVNRGSVWRIEHLAIQNPDGVLSADGQWRAGRRSGTTQLSFQVDASDAGKLLERLGYGSAVKRGRAKLDGKVTWNGAPSSIDYPSLEGNLNLDARRGQFAKLEPGVGRLLGIVSLQALPRRITLDFRDVFSEGFAFESISGSMAIRGGAMQTQNLAIQGPSAKVSMTGEVNLANETQDLKVRVQPTLSETVAIGAAIANPVAGVAAYVAQKVLRDPIEKMFSYEYAVTGTWADPKVEKVAAAAALSNPKP